MTRQPPRRRRFVVDIPRPKRTTERVEVLDVDVIAWVRGFAAARGESDVLEEMRDTDAEDVRRIHALQLGDGAGWFTYLYLKEFDPAATEE